MNEKVAQELYDKSGEIYDLCNILMDAFPGITTMEKGVRLILKEIRSRNSEIHTNLYYETADARRILEGVRRSNA